jgi:glycosyltransferase involved in cell wall biosynthesis
LERLRASVPEDQHIFETDCSLVEQPEASSSVGARAMKLVVLIPALNEEASLAGVLTRVPLSVNGIDEVETIVIDDGSTDGTRHVALACGAHVISHPTNLGLGRAFSNGIDAALRRGADVIVNLDADGQHPPERIDDLIAPILEGRADFTSATRFAHPELIPDMPKLKLFGNSMMARLTGWACGRSFTDVACGFRAYSRLAAMKINIFGTFTYTQESLVDLHRKALTMVEVPIEVRGVRQNGNSRIAHSVLRYGIRTFTILARAVRDRLPLTFFGSIGAILTAAGLATELVVLVNFILTGETTPYQSFTILGAVLVILGAFSFLTALLADMLGRVRETQEQLLYMQRRAYYDERAREHAASTRYQAAPSPAPVEKEGIPAGRQ